jgi:hypothetical protein
VAALAALRKAAQSETNDFGVAFPRRKFDDTATKHTDTKIDSGLTFPPNNSTSARESQCVRKKREKETPKLFTVSSTVCEFFAAKPCNSAQCHANQLAFGQL